MKDTYQIEKITIEEFKKLYANFTKDILFNTEFEISLNFNDYYSIIASNRLNFEIKVYNIIDANRYYEVEDLINSLGLIRTIHTAEIFITKEMLIKILGSDYDISVQVNPNDLINDAAYDIININSIYFKKHIAISYERLKAIANGDAEINRYMKIFNLKVLEKIISARKEQLEKQQISIKEKLKDFQDKISSLTDEEKLYLQSKGVL